MRWLQAGTLPRQMSHDREIPRVRGTFPPPPGSNERDVSAHRRTADGIRIADQNREMNMRGLVPIK